MSGNGAEWNVVQQGGMDLRRMNRKQKSGGGWIGSWRLADANYYMCVCVDTYIYKYIYI